MSGVRLDLLAAARQFRAAPAVALAATITLGVGIGATTAVFSMVAAILSAAEPVPDMDRRVALWSRNTADTETKRPVSPGDFEAWRAQATLLDALVAQRGTSFNLSGIEAPVRASATAVSTRYFDFFRWSPRVGRGFTADDARAGAAPVLVLSDRFWRRQLGANPDVLGRDVRLDGEPARIVGILPPMPATDGIFVPLRLDDAAEDRAARTLFVFGRLRPGVTIEQARAEMESIGRALEAERGGTHRGWTINVRPLQEEFVGAQARLVFGLLFGTAAAVLLIACVNVANLLLARNLARRREMAVRVALGASRWRLARQLVVECAVLAFCGAFLGLIVARWSVLTLGAMFPIESPWLETGGVNLRQLGVAAAAALASVFAVGVLPARQAGRTAEASALENGARAGHARWHRMWSRTLVVAQVAGAVLLLVIAGLLARTLAALESLDPGFDARGVLTAQVTLPERMPMPEAARWFGEALARVSGLPGVTHAAAASRVPFAGTRFNPNRPIVIDGDARPDGRSPFAIDYVVTPGFFRALTLPLVEGREFDARDAATAPPVAMVNATFAREFGGQSPVGRRIRVGSEPEGQWRTVVGVASDVRNDDADQPPVPTVYLPLSQQPRRSMTLVLKTSGEPGDLARPVRAAIAEFDPAQAVYELRSMDDIVEADLGDTRVLIRVLGGFAIIALGLAGLGIWGVLAHLVGQRTREIGLRVALGARGGQVLRMVAVQGLGPVAVGLGVGLTAAIAVARAIRSVLFRVPPFDPVTIVVSVGVLGGVALIAFAGPARRALRLDPAAALRGE